MVRWWERNRSPASAPWPDHIPKGAASYNKWRYIHIRAAKPGRRPLLEDDKDPETVFVLFVRFDDRRALTRLFIKRTRLRDIKSTERKRVKQYRDRFIKELCCRGLLVDPPKGFGKNAKRECSECPRGSKPGG